MEHNLYDNDTDDDSDTLIMDLSDICDKSYDIEEGKWDPFIVSIEMKNHAHEYCALYTYVCNINKSSNCYVFKWCIYIYKYLINYHYSWQTTPAKMLNVKIK